MRHIFFISILTLLMSYSSFLLAVNYQEFTLSTYTRSDENLPDSIHDIIIDDKGYYWIASNEGLYRYDGVQAIKLFSQKGEALHNKMTIALGLDEQNLWFNTGEVLYRMNLQSYNYQSFSHVENQENSLASNHIRQIFTNSKIKYG